MNPNPNNKNGRRKFGPYNIELTNEECVFLSYTIGLMDHAISGIPYERKTDTDISRVDKQDMMDYLAYIIATRDKTIEDACDGDIDKASALIDILNEKITRRMNT